MGLCIEVKILKVIFFGTRSILYFMENPTSYSVTKVKFLVIIGSAKGYCYKGYLTKM